MFQIKLQVLTILGVEFPTVVSWPRPLGLIQFCHFAEIFSLMEALFEKRKSRLENCGDMAFIR